VDDRRDISRYQLERTKQQQRIESSIDWEHELNDQQLAAVRAGGGPVLVLAGAGSGKTRVITYRVAWLLSEQRLRPQNILLLTFTNKAARSMLRRVEQVIGPQARDVTGGTFHHFANLQLRRYAKLLGYDSNFTILDETDCVQVMKLCRSERGLDKAERAFPSARLLSRMHSTMVNTALDLESLLASRFPHLMEQHADIERVFIDYMERKRQSNQMDFDDLLINLHKLLVEHPAARDKMASRFAHVLVDEYQDVNHLQADIVRRLFLGATGPPAAPEPLPSIGEQLSRQSQTSPSPDQPTPPPGTTDPNLEEGLEIIYPDETQSHSQWDEEDQKHGDEGSEVERGQVAGTQAGGVTAGGSEQPAAGEDMPAGSGEDAELPPEYGMHRGLFVVGDDAQSIYAFRGADFENIRHFHNQFPGTRIFKLEINYRSVPQILTLANGVMDEADPQFRKELSAVKPAGDERPLLLATQDVSDQADFVAEQILALREQQGLEFRDIAVLYRAHNNRMEVELELTQRGIPFVVRGGLRFFEQAHIKDLLCYVQVVANSRDELAWQRMMQMCPRVGPVTIGKVLGALRSARDEDGGMLGGFINNGAAKLASGQGKKHLAQLKEFLAGLSAEAPKLGVADLITRVIEERYRAYLEVTYENYHQRLEDLEQLAVFGSRFDTLEAFLAEIGLNTDISGSRTTGEVYTGDEDGAVTLSTIHQAKGLEWRAVFIIHLSDDVLPHRMTHGQAGEEDEERRLLYVAVTRAEELLFMSYPQLTETRDFSRLINRPSRFLAELPGECYDQATLEWGGE